MCNIRFLCLLLALMCAVMLPVACNNDDQSADFSSWQKAGLYYSNPYDGQKEVPLHALVVLQFSDPVTSTPENIKDQVTWASADGRNVDFSVNITEDRRSLVLIPDGDKNFEPHTDDCLKPATQYTVSAQGLKTAIGGVEFPEGGISFTTRAAVNGAGDQITANGYTGKPFQIARMIPDGQNLQFMDFSTIRLQFTQPVDRGSVEYGNTVSLEDGRGNPVEAGVVVSGSYMSIDPAVSYLDPSAIYHLRLTEGIRSITGTALDPGYYSDLALQPRNSASPEGERAVLVSKVSASDEVPSGQCTENCEYRSPLSGMPINCVSLKAMMLGQENNTQQTGDMHAELAYAPDYPNPAPLPLRIPRGSLLKGTNMEIMINGVVPAGFETGEILTTFITDANGYLIPNPHSDNADAPRHLRLYMDIALNTEGAKANGAVGQDLLHMEVVGTAIVKEGVMVIDAMTVLDPKILGVEESYGVLSLHMESYYDQVNAPAMAEDKTAPAVQSWVPGTENAEELRPGDPIIVNFTEPLDRSSIQAVIDNGSLTLNGGRDFSWHLDGATLVLRPNTGLEYGVSYDLDIPMTVTDLAGNGLRENFSCSFTMPGYASSGTFRSPIALTAYPGYPCANTVGIDESLLTTDGQGNMYQGRVAGGKTSDDLLPVMDLPANRPIRVQFSQVMDTDTITAGDSFVVEQFEDDSTWSGVPGRLEKDPRRVRFYPDTPWEDGVLYRYRLLSNQIRDEFGYPLQTNLLEKPGPTTAGPNLVNYFHGAPETDAVFLALRNLPVIDVNSNYAYDAGEDDPDENSGPVTDFVDVDDTYPPNIVDSGNYIPEENSTMIKIAKVGGLATDAYFKTRTGRQEQDFTWLTHALDVEIVGSMPYTGFDESYEGEAVRANIYPTRLVGSNLDMVAMVGILGIGILPSNAPTGPMAMRFRYKDDDGVIPYKDGGVIPGWIKDTDYGPVFETEVDIYLDAPYLAPTLLLDFTSYLLPHNLHSYQFKVQVRGRIIFLEDGRMTIRIITLKMVPINVKVDLNLGIIISGAVTVDLEIPKGGLFLHYMQLPLKE